MVAERGSMTSIVRESCSLAKISMVAELKERVYHAQFSCSLAKISMVAELKGVDG